MPYGPPEDHTPPDLPTQSQSVSECMYRVFFEGVISSNGPSGRCGPRAGNAPSKANRSRPQNDDVSIDILICYLAKWSDVGGGMTVSTRGRRKVYLARAGWTWNR